MRSESEVVFTRAHCKQYRRIKPAKPDGFFSAAHRLSAQPGELKALPGRRKKWVKFGVGRHARAPVQLSARTLDGSGSISGVRAKTTADAPTSTAARSYSGRAQSLGVARPPSANYYFTRAYCDRGRPPLRARRRRDFALFALCAIIVCRRASGSTGERDRATEYIILHILHVDRARDNTTAY